MKKIVFETERLCLRQLNFDDAKFILKLLNERSYIENIGDKNVQTQDDAKIYLMNGPMDSYKKNDFGLYCVELKASKKRIGTCGLLKRSVLEDVDIGYAFLPQFCSKGYAREAVAGVLSHSKKALNLKRIAAVVNPDNKSSNRLLEKLGFRYKRMGNFIQGKPEVKLFILDL